MSFCYNPVVLLFCLVQRQTSNFLGGHSVTLVTAVPEHFANIKYFIFRAFLQGSKVWSIPIWKLGNGVTDRLRWRIAYLSSIEDLIFQDTLHFWQMYSNHYSCWIQFCLWAEIPSWIFITWATHNYWVFWKYVL